MKSPNGFSSGGRLRVHMCASSHHNKRHRWVRKRINELKQAQKAEAFSSRFLQMYKFFFVSFYKFAMMQHPLLCDITPPTGDSLHSTTPIADACSSSSFLTIYS